MFGHGLNKSSELLNFKTSNQGIPAANFLLASAPPVIDWWTNNAVTAPWMVINNLFNGNATDNTFGNVSYPSSGSALGEVFIHDDFIVDADLVIQYTEIKMSGNARIVVKSGRVLILSSCYLHACEENTAMWKGIEVEDGAFLQLIGNTKIEDALKAVTCENNSFLDVNQVILNRNLIGIELNGPVVKGAPDATEGPVFERVSFTCVPQSCLTTNGFNPNAIYATANLNPPYANVHSESGIVMYRMGQGHMPKIGLSNVALSENYFVNLDIGVKANNSWLRVLNSSFFDIHPDQGLPNPAGIAVDIYAPPVAFSAAQVKCTVGDDNVSTLYDRCIFNTCKTGIRVYGPSNISILNNAFTGGLESPVILNKIQQAEIRINSNVINSFSRYGISMRDCISNRILQVWSNTISLPAGPVAANTKFNLAAVYIVNTPIGFSGADVSYNTFENVRFGMYGNGLQRGSISYNVVKFNNTWSDMQGAMHAGVWLEGSNNIEILTNVVTFDDTQAGQLPSTSGIEQVLRGIVLKGVNNSHVNYNTIKNCGRPIRCVDNLLSTEFLCNTFDACFSSWQFTYVDLSNQGGLGFPTDNKWKNYPRLNASSPNPPKLSGDLKSPIDFYYRPLTTPSVDYHLNLSGANTCVNLTPKQAAGDGPCSMQLPPYDPSTVLDFVLQDSTYIENDSLYNEEKARWAVFAAANDSLMQIPDYVYWCNNLQNAEAGIYARLLDSSYNRANLIGDLEGISNFRLPEYELKRDIFRAALSNQLSEVDERLYDTLEIAPLGYTPAWLSTNVVYLIRGLFEQEVDDEELGLRMASNTVSKENCGIEVMENELRLIFKVAAPASLCIYNVSGQLLLRKNFEKETIVEKSALSPFSIYKVNVGNCIKTGKCVQLK